jgi:hypothetical protein
MYIVTYLDVRHPKINIRVNPWYNINNECFRGEKLDCKIWRARNY